MHPPSLSIPQRIGLLFVHGIGEQKRFEHLTNSVAELAQLIVRADRQARVSVVDRTSEWTLPPGEPDPAGTPPVTLSVRSPDTQIDFECHEVWWADLGSRAGVFDALTFWLWGLGQWAAPIYRQVDASKLDKDDRSYTKPVPRLAKLPQGITGDLRHEPFARMKLMAAAMAAAFVAVTWVLLKRLAGSLLGQAPSPTLIVQYVGDVRTYTEFGGPSAGDVSDPGHPRRVGIRRRMVREMVALASKPIDGWYVLSHSLGTVLAYNGLTEIGHVLPNYLTEAQWRRLPAKFKIDPGGLPRRDLEGMMPARPPWLSDDERINRPLLFANIKGLLTYGSPLGKFAALWPRIVATATDREDGRKPFPAGCRWINLAAPHDPVAGMLDCFPTGPKDPLHGAIPTVENVRTPPGLLFGLSHIQYLRNSERYAKGLGIDQKVSVARWLLGQNPQFASFPLSEAGKLFRVTIPYALVIATLWICTAFAVAGLRALGWAV